jgi:hypothetical protein
LTQVTRGIEGTSAGASDASGVLLLRLGAAGGLAAIATLDGETRADWVIGGAVTANSAVIGSAAVRRASWLTDAQPVRVRDDVRALALGDDRALPIYVADDSQTVEA